MKKIKYIVLFFALLFSYGAVIAEDDDNNSGIDETTSTGPEPIRTPCGGCVPEPD